MAALFQDLSPSEVIMAETIYCAVYGTPNCNTQRRDSDALGWLNSLFLKRCLQDFCDPAIQAFIS